MASHLGECQAAKPQYRRKTEKRSFYGVQENKDCIVFKLDMLPNKEMRDCLGSLHIITKGRCVGG